MSADLPELIQKWRRQTRNEELLAILDAAEQGLVLQAKIGRPRLEDRAKTLTATKPWVAAGMSRRTWYRRRAEKRAT